jgi:hypothetical protein
VEVEKNQGFLTVDDVSLSRVTFISQLEGYLSPSRIPGGQVEAFRSQYFACHKPNWELIQVALVGIPPSIRDIRAPFETAFSPPRKRLKALHVLTETYPADVEATVLLQTFCQFHGVLMFDDSDAVVSQSLDYQRR